jgi:hypothetical protein
MKDPSNSLDAAFFVEARASMTTTSVGMESGTA